ncbi:MAG TPA: cobalt ABC transporter ATP-binding protein [Bavariicoccus seileri]|uniref:Cobalt ABC transporter ATP-binding protein n=1 Tax=Bavariicoccus seileri TaxID=549685 RepID=A0A3D4S441_9ENTE|nr:ABC transporter ATP-binding protein [Bavariicoccus seileri]HCS93262.1 cobalt ABC transporter ATP-binding protein [Bavariicoccus seileri]
MITIRNLSFTYPGSQKTTLNQINLDIKKGSFVAVVGNNGCGKSTLCKAINGLIPHFYEGDYSGEVKVDGTLVTEADISEIAQLVGYVYQDFENQIVRPTVLDDASFACLNYGRMDYLQRGETAIKQVGLSHKLKDFIWELSGGQKHLLALAGALSLNPDVLILDEPIAQLDPLKAKEIYRTLKYLNEKLGKTIIVIEHHTDFIAEYCEEVILVKEGRIKWHKRTKEALNLVEDLIAEHVYPPSVTIVAQRLEKQIGKKTTDQFPISYDEARGYIEMLITQGLIGNHSGVSGNNTKNEIVEETEKGKNITKIRKSVTIKEEIKKGKEIRGKANIEKPLIRLDHISFSYAKKAKKREEKLLFNDLSCDIYHGERIALVGSNGAGKTSLLKIMMGLTKPLHGLVYLEGKDVSAVPFSEVTEKITYIYQNPEEMFIRDSIRSDIEYAMKERNHQDYQERATALINQFSLSEIESSDGRLLSGGQMRRASLAIGMALEPELVLLDEPTASLDIATRHQILKTLNDLASGDKTVVIATHDLQLMSEWAERIIVLHDGKMIADGSKNQIFNDNMVADLVGIKAPDIFKLGKIIHPNLNSYTIDQFVGSIKGGTII